MIKAFQNKLPYFQFHLLQSYSDDLTHAVLSRNGGISKSAYDSLNISYDVQDNAQDVAKNRQIIKDAFKIEPSNLLSARQTHSKNVLIVTKEIWEHHSAQQASLQTSQSLLNSEQTTLVPEHEFDNKDAMITNLPGVALMMKVADCQAIIMHDPTKQAFAVVHAGWKGLVQDVSGHTIKVMRAQYGVHPENLIIGISPSLGPCCAYFSDPELELPKNFRPYIDTKKRVNLWDFSVNQLLSHGVQADRIELARVCSMCGAGNKFFSFRRDRGITGRFGVFAMLKPKQAASP